MNWKTKVDGGSLDLREHRWRVIAAGSVVAHFSNEGAAKATARFLGGCIGNGGTGIEHAVEPPQRHRDVLAGGVQ